MAHIILFLFIAAEYADLADIRMEETAEDGVAKAAGAAGDQEGLLENNLMNGLLSGRVVGL